MSGTPMGESSFEGTNMNAEESRSYLAGLARFQASLKNLHQAEAELAGIRAELAQSGIDLDMKDSLHW